MCNKTINTQETSLQSLEQQHAQNRNLKNQFTHMYVNKKNHQNYNHISI